MLPAPQLFKQVRIIKVRLWLKGKLCLNIKNKDIVQFKENNKSRKIEVKYDLKYIRIPNLMLYFYTC